MALIAAGQHATQSYERVSIFPNTNNNWEIGHYVTCLDELEDFLQYVSCGKRIRTCENECAFSDVVFGRSAGKSASGAAFLPSLGLTIFFLFWRGKGLYTQGLPQ